MSSSSEEKEIVVITFACHELEKAERLFWIHEINLKREEFGEFHHLFSDLLRDEERSFKYFRMSSAKFVELLRMLPLQKNETNFRKSILVAEGLAVTMKFLCYGGSFSSISFSYRLGESTVRKIIFESCNLIWEILATKFMPTPSREQWLKVDEEFSTLWHYPNCIGAVDGKHVVFEKSLNTGSLYFNYKKEFSIFLLAVVRVQIHYR
ncbi:hypothetical protein PR048_015711 [Dryococelus australis]|uniref:DDE Tnp4 domain-containing protein n=1 Tax=Dryococelus australis TaxID=614101 RepID=A0ABQ9HHP5_9NEOP|nr:hypothetical protein PR048_015711 [Dryococelus australis]